MDQGIRPLSSKEVVSRSTGYQASISGASYFLWAIGYLTAVLGE